MNPKMMFINPHPKGMWIIAISSIFFTVGIASIVNAFVPFAVQTLLLKNDVAYNISSVAFLFLLNFSALAGGILGHFYNHRRSVIAGGLFSTIGLGLIAIPNLSLIGVSTYSVGVGLIIPNLYTLLSQLYAINNPKRLSGFMIIYLAANIGFFFSTALADILPQYIGFGNFFLISGLFTLIGTYIFLFSEQDFRIKPGIELYKNANKHSYYSLFFILVILSFFANYFLQRLLFSISTILFLSLVSLCFIFYLAQKSKISPEKPRSSMLIFILFICSGFWLANRVSIIIFSQYSHIILNSKLFNITSMPINILYAINVLIVALVGIYLARLWHKRKRQTGAKTILKVCTISLLLTSITYLLFWICANGFISNINTNSIIIIIATIIISISEIVLAPIYFATAGKFAPRKYESIIIGIQQLFVGLMGCIAVAITHQSIEFNKFMQLKNINLSITEICIYLFCFLFFVAIVSYISNYFLRD